jgi:REP element-mobilizing transposase RayT
MARPWRIQYPGAVYHVTARGNRRQNIYLSDGDRLDFIDLLGRTAARYDLRVLAFCLMSNHYHLFLRTPQANLSAALHWLNASYSIRFNRRRRLSGHLLQGRFKAALVTDEAHWHQLSLYLHLNPVRAGLIEDPADYEWSSCSDYLRPRPRFAWLDGTEVLSGYGRGKAAARRYRAALDGAVTQTPAYWAEFQREMADAARAEMADRAEVHPPAGNLIYVPEYSQAHRKAPDLRAELGRLARAFKLDPADILRPRRDFPPRLAAYYHLVETQRAKVAAVARLFAITPGAVSQGLAQCRRLMAADPDLAHTIERLSDKL